MPRKKGQREERKKKALGIYELLGIAVGCIGMSRKDFLECTFKEFESIYSAWYEMNDMQHRDAWERARVLAAISIQPYSKKKLTPRQLLPLPWDKSDQTRTDTQILTPEERAKRAKRIALLAGYKV